MFRSLVAPLPRDRWLLSKTKPSFIFVITLCFYVYCTHVRQQKHIIRIDGTFTQQPTKQRHGCHHFCNWCGSPTLWPVGPRAPYFRLEWCSFNDFFSFKGCSWFCFSLFRFGVSCPNISWNEHFWNIYRKTHYIINKFVCSLPDWSMDQVIDYPIISFSDSLNLLEIIHAY